MVMKCIKKPKFSIIIPTRERSDTLEATIRTCVSQDYDNFEIIVSDNCSQDTTKEVVDSFRDNRLVYVNTGKRISMSHNWEFALSHVRGDFITYLGDDDGLLPGALNELARIIDNTGCQAISWRSADYCWPNLQQQSKNLLIIPGGKKLCKLNSQDSLIGVLKFKKSYYELPLLYKGLVSNKIIQRIKESSEGTFFHSMTPDVYASIVIACATDHYWYSKRPYSINGASSHSTGCSFFTTSDKFQKKRPREMFLSEKNIPCHQDLVLAPSIAISVAECFLQARDHFPPAQQYRIGIRDVIAAAIREAIHAPLERYSSVVDAISKIAELHLLREFTAQLVKSMRHVPYETTVALVPGYNIVLNRFILDCSATAIEDVYQASLLCKIFLEHKKLGLALDKVAILKTNLKIFKGLLKRYWKT
jgi:glycosyltransferase involved in cell wall biosynthesis